jgi:penicillin-binding protein 1A
MPYQGKHVDNPSENGKKTWRQAWWFWSLVAVLVLAVAGAASFAGGIWYFSRDLPSIENLKDYRPSLVTKVYGEGGSLIGQFYVERRILVPFEKIPEVDRKIIIAVEDSRFYEHKGVDPLGILRAFLTNLKSFSLRQGGSTITQQLVRSLFLTPEKSFTRKIKEAILAWKLEKLMTKDEILELYLNQIYFGHGAYGIQSAARNYFDKDIGELSLAEVAFIAGLPRAPSDYSPYVNPERAKRRQGVVLRRMVDEKLITEEQFKELYQQDLYFKKRGKEETIAPYFLEMIRQYLSAKYGETMVYKGGLKVYTTLSPALQKIANDALESGLRELDKRQGYRGPVGHKSEEEVAELKTNPGGKLLTDIEPGNILEGVVAEVDKKGATVYVSGLPGRIGLSGMTWARRRLEGNDLIHDVSNHPKDKPTDILSPGDVVQVKILRVDRKKDRLVLALDQEPVVEGALISLDPRTGAIKAMVGGYDFKRSQFNRAVAARRQPGSAFKPIIYATALSQGMTPATVLLDAPIVYTDETTAKVWKPENYESRFYGPISLREALIHSRNLATVHLLDRVGIRNVIRFAEKLGIREKLTPDLSLALGSSVVTLEELTSAYGVFANEGVRVDPVSVLSVEDSYGNILEEHLPAAERAISRETAYLITNILMDVVQHGTGQRAKVLGRPLAGKTGTTNDFTDAWFVGFAPNLATGVWVGFDDMRSLGNREAGARAALPIWIAYNRSALEQVPPATFSMPDDVSFVRVDPKTGLQAPRGEKDAVIEIFAKGTEPKTESRSAPKPSDFYRVDSAVDF